MIQLDYVIGWFKLADQMDEDWAFLSMFQDPGFQTGWDRIGTRIPRAERFWSELLFNNDNSIYLYSAYNNVNIMLNAHFSKTQSNDIDPDDLVGATFSSSKADNVFSAAILYGNRESKPINIGKWV